MDVKALIIILMSSVLVDNYVLNRFLGICPFLGVSKKVNQSVGMGAAVIFVMLVATAVTWPIYNLVMVPLHLEFLQTLFFILVIASLVQLVEFFLKKTSPGLYNAMGVYLALITTNCAVLAITINCIKNNFSYSQSLIYAFGSAIGFVISMVVMSGVRSRIKTANIPESFKGTPILFVAAAFLSLAFMGFKGLIK